MTKELVIFDGDDTLWFVEPLYDRARSAAAAIVAAAGLDPAEWERRQRRIDVENVSAFGVSADRFPTSCRMAYEALAAAAKTPARPEVSEAVWRAAASVFESQAPAAQGLREVLAGLRPLYTLALLTKGEEWVQRKRIAEAGVDHDFAMVEIVRDKGEAEFRHLLDIFGVRAADAWSIGNSLASDINPALRLGMNAIWIDAHVWEHERRDRLPAEGNLVIAPTLLSVLGTLGVGRGRDRRKTQPA